MSTDDRYPAGSLPSPQTLADLPATLARRLAAAGQRRRWRRGDVVLRQGSRTDAVVICHEGRLRASQGTPSGDETLLRFMLPGELMGVPPRIDPCYPPVADVCQDYAMASTKVSFWDGLGLTPGCGNGIRALHAGGARCWGPRRVRR